MENPVNKFKYIAILFSFLMVAHVSILTANEIPSVLAKGRGTAQKVTVTLEEAQRMAGEMAKKASEETAQAFLRNMPKDVAAFSSAVDKAPDSRLKRAIKISAWIAGGLIPIVSGILCYRYDVYGIGTLIGSYGSWWQSFRNWLGIRRLEDGQASMQRTLDAHTDTLAEHGQQLQQVIVTQGEHGDRLNGLAAGQQRLQAGQEEFRKEAGTQFEQLQSRLAQTATQAGVNSRFDQLESAVSDAHAKTGQRLDSMQGQLSDMQGRLGYLCTVAQAAQLARKPGTSGVPHLPVVGFPGGFPSNPSFGRGRGFMIPRIEYPGHRPS